MRNLIAILLFSISNLAYSSASINACAVFYALEKTSEKSTYEILNKRFTEKYPDLDVILKDPDRFVAEMKRRFKHEKDSGRDPLQFPYEELGKPAIDYTYNSLVDMISKVRIEISQHQSQIEKNRLNFIKKSFLRKKIKDLLFAIDYAGELVGEIQKVRDDGYRYMQVIGVSYYAARLLGHFDYRNLDLYQKSTLWIDDGINGYLQKSLSQEYQMYKKRVSPFFQFKPLGNQFPKSTMPFKIASEGTDYLEFLIIPTAENLERDIFYRLMPIPVHFVGLSDKPILADGFNRPSGLFWMHDVRHEAIKYFKKVRYLKRSKISSEKFERINRLSEKWFLEYEEQLATIKDPELKEAVDLFFFNYHHDLGNPLIPSEFKPSRYREVIYTLYFQMRWSGQGTGFGKPFKRVPEAEEWIRQFWKKREHEEQEIIKDSVSEISKKEEMSVVATSKTREINNPFYTAWHEIPNANTEILLDSYNALNARVSALTGSELPIDVFQRKDIIYRPSMDRAPNLKAIYLYALNARLDFSTGPILEALKFHASRGTKVVVVLSQANQRLFSVSPVDQAQAIKQQEFLDAIQAAGPNVKTVFWGESGGGNSDSGSIKNLTTAMHAKALITIGHDQADSVYIGGGRNAADNFYLEEPGDYSSQPEYIKYKDKSKKLKGDTNFYSVTDLDFKISDHGFALSAARQLASLLKTSDQAQFVVEPEAITNNVAQKSDQSTKIRHFLSRPKLDDKALEKELIENIKMAKKRIQIITPYVGKISAVLAELVSAANRGVEVELITNVEIKGDDFLPGLVGAANKVNIKKIMQNMKVYGWNYKKPMVHIKVLRIDDDYVTSHAFNWNYRSMNKDIENGVEMIGRDAVVKFEELFNQIKTDLADPVVELEKVAFIKKVAVALIGKNF